MRSILNIAITAAVLAGGVAPACAQSGTDGEHRTDSNGASGNTGAPKVEAKRLFGIVPNYRTSPDFATREPLRPKEKFKLAADDAFDRGTLALAGMFAGLGQLTNGDRSFGQGAKGYTHYAVTSYADFLIGDYMTEGVLPSLLHQDPRYFRKGCCGLGRLRYAAGQIFWTHTDSGAGQFNYSEVVGNSAAVAISMAYYPDGRDAMSGASKFASQLTVDMISNIVKEFWPEISRTLSRKHRAKGEVR
jgi:hypothetical protein